MAHIGSRLGVVVFVIALVGLSSSAANAQSWNQVWSDEFNLTGAANASYWTYELGNNGGWGNSELEYYQGGSANGFQSGGALTIQARRESVGGMAYTSARINTLGKYSFGPGDAAAVKLEARIQGPTGQGMWPAFWMLGTDISTVPWPGCGEIDIMEHINNVPNVYGTIHWADVNNNHVSYQPAAPAMTTFSSYHTYGLTWDANLLTWYLDGANVGAANIQNSINNTGAFHKSFYVVFNLSVGGTWPGNPDGTTPFPANMNVDYLRYYQAGSATATATATSTPTPTKTATPNGRATATATATKTATATATASGKCSGVSTFASCTAYASGAKVVFSNVLYHSIATIPTTRDCPPNSPFNPTNDNWWVNDGGC
jgi:beta-glucanase (GH16 family)